MSFYRVEGTFVLHFLNKWFYEYSDKCCRKASLQCGYDISFGQLVYICAHLFTKPFFCFIFQDILYFSGMQAISSSYVASSQVNAYKSGSYCQFSPAIILAPIGPDQESIQPNILLVLSKRFANLHVFLSILSQVSRLLQNVKSNTNDDTILCNHLGRLH